MHLIVLVVNFLLYALLLIEAVGLMNGSTVLRTMPLQAGGLATVGLRLLDRKWPVPTSFIKQPVIVAMGVYLLWALVSYCYATNRALFLIWLNNRLMFMVLPVYIFSCLPKKPSDLLWCLQSYGLVTFFWALHAWWFAFSVRFSEFYTLPGESKNAVGTVFALTAVIGFGLFLTRRKLSWRIIYLLTTLVGLVAMLATQSRAATLGTVMSLLVMMGLAKIRPRYIIACLLAFAVGGVILMQALPKETVARNLDTGETSSAQWRVIASGYVIDYFVNHPLKPLGLGNPLVVTNYLLDGDLIPNVLLQDLVELGLPGAMLSFAMFALAIWLGISNAALLPVNSRSAAVNLCATGIMITNIIHGNLDSFWSQIWDYSSTFAALGMAIFIRSQIDEQTDRQIARQYADTD